jgi:acylphosphatase
MATPIFRLEAVYAGRVQGVGFRYTARLLAQGYEVTGQVRNLPDGRVEVIAEGEEAEVRAFMAEVREEMAQHVKETAERVLDGPAQHRDFLIG